MNDEQNEITLVKATSRAFRKGVLCGVVIWGIARFIVWSLA